MLLVVVCTLLLSATIMTITIIELIRRQFQKCSHNMLFPHLIIILTQVRPYPNGDNSVLNLNRNTGNLSRRLRLRSVFKLSERVVNNLKSKNMSCLRGSSASTTAMMAKVTQLLNHEQEEIQKQ